MSVNAIRDSEWVSECVFQFTSFDGLSFGFKCSVHSIPFWHTGGVIDYILLFHSTVWIKQFSIALHLTFNHFILLFVKSNEKKTNPPVSSASIKIFSPFNLNKSNVLECDLVGRRYIESKYKISRHIHNAPPMVVVSQINATKRYFVEMDFDSRQSIYFTANSTDFDLFLAWFAIKAHKFHCSMQWLIPQLFSLCIAFVGLTAWLPAIHLFTFYCQSMHAISWDPVIAPN